jgi:hypothetical protein
MSDSVESTAVVYQTRLVHQQNSEVHGRNLFATPEAAMHYLEDYVQIRFDADPADWREDESPNLSKWSMYPGGLPARAVVSEREVHDSAVELLEKTREVQEEVEGVTA